MARQELTDEEVERELSLVNLSVDRGNLIGGTVRILTASGDVLGQGRDLRSAVRDVPLAFLRGTDLGDT